MAEQFGIRLSVSLADLVTSINEAIAKINSGNSLHKVKIGADTSELESAIKRIKSEIASITGRSSTTPVALGTTRADGQATLDELAALRKAEEELANPVGMAAVQAEFNKTAEIVKGLTSAVAAFKAEYASIAGINTSINLGNPDITGTNIGDTVKQSIDQNIKSLERQAQAEKDVANASKASSDAAVKGNEAEKRSIDAITEAVKQQEIAKNRTTTTASGNVYQSTTYGTSAKNTTINYENGKETSTTVVENFAKMQQEAIKADRAINDVINDVEKLKNTYADPNTNKNLVNTAHFDVLEQKYNNIIQLVESFKNAETKNTEQFKTDTDVKVKELERLIDLYQRAQYSPSSLRAKDVGTLTSVSANQLDEFISKISASNVPIEKMKGTIDSLKQSLAGITDSGSLVKFLNEFSVAQSEFSKLKTESDTVAKTIRDIETAMKSLDSISNKAIFMQSKGDDRVVSLRNDVESIKTSYQGLIDLLKKGGTAENVAKARTEMEALREKTQNAAAEANVLATSLGNVKIDENTLRKAEELRARLVALKNANSAGMGKTDSNGLTFGAQIDELIAKIPEAAALGDKFVTSLSNDARIIEARMKSVGAVGKTVFQEMQEKAAKFIKWTAMTMAITKIRMYFNRLFTTVYQLDESLVDLRKTFTGVDEELNDFYFDANRLAKQLGVTTDAIIKQASAWSRMGYSTKEAMETMAKMSSMFAAISPDMGVDEATDGLISIMKAFNIDPENVLDGILSKVNIIGNTAGTTNGEIVEMLKRSSAAMSAANNTLEQTIALGTAGVEILRDSAKMGTALKSLSMNIRALDEETGEVVGDVQEINSQIAELTRTASTPGGISIFTDETRTTFRSTYDILRDISKVWNEISDADQADLQRVLGGKYQGNAVAAIIQNFEAAEKAMNNMQNSLGSAEAEMDTIRKSAAYAMNELKETFTSLAQHSVSREELRDLIKFGTNFLKILDGIVKTFGALPTVIGATAGAITAFKKKGAGLFGYNEKGNLTFWGAETSNGLKSWFKEKTDPTGEKTAIKDNIRAIKEFDNAIKTNSMNLQTYNAVMKNSNEDVKRYGRAVMQGTDQAKSFNNINKQLKKELKQVGKNAKTAADGTKELGLGMKLLNTASSIFISMGITWVINQIITGFTTMVKWADKYSEKALEAIDKSKSLQSQIDSTNDELTTTKLRIDELNKLDNPTIIEQEELDRLLQVNAQLENTKKSLESMLRVSQTEAAEATVEWWKTIKNGGLGAKDDSWFTTAWKFFPRLWSGTLQDLNGKGYQQFIDAIYDFKQAQEEITKLEEEKAKTIDDKEIAKLDKKLEKLNKDLEEARRKADNNYSDWTAKISTLDLNNAEQKAIYDEMQEIIGWWEYFSGKQKSTLVEILNDPNFATVKNALIDLWKQGKLTEEEFAKITEESVTGIEAFKEALADNGYEDFEEILRAIIKYFKETVKDAGDATKAIRTFAEAIEACKEEINDFLSKQQDLVEAFKKIELGGKLAREEVYKLVESMPFLAKYLKETADGWEISADNFDRASQQLIENEKKSLQEKIDTTQKYLEILGNAKSLAFQKEFSNSDPLLDAKYEEAMEKARKIYDALGIKTDEDINDAFKDLTEQLNGYLFMYDLVDETFDKHSLALEGLKERYNDVKSEISDYNKQIQTIDSSIKTLNKDSRLSYDELNELLDIDPYLQYDKQEDGMYTVSIEALEELREKSYETRNARIDDVQSVLAEEIAAAETAKAKYEQEIQKAGEMGTSAQALEMLAEATKGLEGVNAQLEYCYGLQKKLNGYKLEITYGDDVEDKFSDKLQNEIDYYKSIFEAVEIMRDKYTEAIDKEIDALEEVKDSLKEENDERQRALDLAEALTNLENAKKRKVWVYSDDGGFKQVQDQGAVKKAAEEYRDVITDIQEAEIDKKIKELENQQKQIEESVKDLTDFEKNLKDAITVEQAKTALGLADEKDLLNLSEAVREGIKNGFADALVTKENEDNKEKTDRNDNPLYAPVTLDDVFKSVGASVTAEDIKAISSSLPTLAEYAAAQTAAANMNQYKEMATSTVINNTGNNISVTNNIYDARDPEKVAAAVRDEIAGLFTKVENSIK